LADHGATGSTTAWVFDPPSGLVEAKRDAASVTTNYTYNVRGQMQAIISPRTNESNQRLTITHTYDETTGELLGKSYNDGTAALNYADRTPSLGYTYTRTGQLESVIQGAGTSTVFTHKLNRDSAAPWRIGAEEWGSLYGDRLLSHAYEASSEVGSSGGYGVTTLATVRGRPNGFAIGNRANLTQDRAEAVYYSSLGRVAAVVTRAGSTVSREFRYGYTANSSLLAGYTSGSFAANYRVRGQSRSRDGGQRHLDDQRRGLDCPIRLHQRPGGPALRHQAVLQPRSAAGALGAFADRGGSIFYRYAYDGRGEMVSGAAYLMEQPIPMSADPGPYSSMQLPERNFYYAFDQAGNRLSAGRNGPSSSLDGYVPNCSTSTRASSTSGCRWPARRMRTRWCL
jgi:hypothetical protein